MSQRRDRIVWRKGGRFDPDLIAIRMEQLRGLAGVEPKDVGIVVFPKQQPENAARSWYKLTTQRRLPFTPEQIERALDYLLPRAYAQGRITNPNLPGFPFVDIEIAARPPPPPWEVAPQA